MLSRISGEAILAEGSNGRGVHDSNFSSHEEAGDIFYLVSVAICSKLIQEGEPNKTRTN